ncbi:MAG: hypothetical protein WKG07_17980 [Hymenobacter sp.]
MTDNQNAAPRGRAFVASLAGKRPDFVFVGENLWQKYIKHQKELEVETIQTEINGPAKSRKKKLKLLIYVKRKQRNPRKK